MAPRKHCHTNTIADPRAVAAGESGVDDFTTSALLERATAGDGAAWDAVVRRYANLLKAVTWQYRLSQEDAADAMQMTWLRCVEHADRIRDPERLGAWLATTCRRECLRVLRNAGRQVPVDPSGGEDRRGGSARVLAELPADSRQAPETVVLREADAAALRDAVQELTDRQRSVLQALSVAEELGRGYADVAADLRIPVGSLGPTRQRALRHLRRELDPAAA